MKTKRLSRRDFILNSTIGASALLLGPALSALALTKPDKRLGIALVGLGGYSSGQLAPALQHTKNCYLAGIVTGTPAKAKSWAAKYSIPQKNIYNYQNFDNIARNPDIDIIYVVLPVSMHKEYTIRAARAGKHVICEKPMALNAAECREMIAACKKANRLLSIGYRLHFEPHTQEVMRLGQKQVFGKVTKIDTGNGFTYNGDPNAWRLKKAMAGGGGLMDMGIYAIQGARYTLGQEPIAVKATQQKTRPQFFKEVDETVFWELKFPGGQKVTGKSSYNNDWSYLQVEAEKGNFELQPAYGYGGLDGKVNGKPMQIPNIIQQAAQMDDFATCVQLKKQSRVPGEEGLMDMKVVDAVYRSLNSGQWENIV
ncbi:MULTISPECIES: Gfo/Idh/MocA family oxidoreductase [unclassified Mucilaginibacter]|uniref:Gfo/Idh/MocA family protein n=1 Tax=unclassified Mucilaginibacter TaxID=2617802 RepID=UPI002AC96545|nr:MULTISPECIES: Gfo/Idh/MocA family oxidoreductase [unclassified Mucilaginibacter]MEB0261445.1 Gfo/Idh/MocA family oxidoreductase [Mucilaginibacter sp. 10I4]MEB0276969.1 Gfo/Idh/MocA family oxidoreductase [Mucilaginibacter sp. 10B2]MEB0301508.1 Gfo/Idh/MocA family oxidoreductase [Mucilaginibacter sp. 5C4]WPX25069.1 Gfo/Idh/MocA family oxidoreductase [Mucilaginibacter sp. 5C4]